MIVGNKIIKEDHVPKMMVDNIFNLRDSYFLDNLNIYIFFSLSLSFFSFFLRKSFGSAHCNMVVV